MMMGNTFNLTPPEPGKFLNREEQLKAGIRGLKELRRDSSKLQVLEVHGYGGMGKTRLLEQLQEIAEFRSPPDHVIWVALEADASATEMGPLIRIRNQLDFECLLFDAALVTFWQVTGERPRLEVSSRLARSLPVQAIQSVGMAAGAPAPFGFALEAFQFAKGRYAKWDRYRPEEFEAIGALSRTPGEIWKLLPNYLGVDIKRALGREEEFLAFYDGYEKQRLETRRNPNPWLRELVATLGRGLHVISTREPLKWGRFDDTEIELVDVRELPEPQSREMLQARLGRLNEEVEDRLLEASHRIPFFLESVVESVKSRYLAGDNLDLSSLPSSPEDSVGHLLKHLPENQQKLVVVLATLQVFDQRVFECLTGKPDSPLHPLPFDSFIDHFFIESVAPDLYKTHDLLTDFVRGSDEVKETREAGLQIVTKDLPLRSGSSEISDPHALLALLSAVVSGWYSVEEVPTCSIEALVDAGYLLYDAGYWNELGWLPSEEGHPAAVVADFFAALAARRGKDVGTALALLNAMEDRFSLLGRHSLSAALEVAYLTELAGDYDGARRKFDELEKRIPRFKLTNRLHLRLRLYQADMLTMDGCLQEASRLLAETYESDDVSTIDWIELVRHRGHALRFSFLFETAEQLYLKALQGAEEIKSIPLQGKLWTNLAEVSCWHDPHRALEAVRRSTELNGQVDNKIERAKCEAARAIALAKLGDKDAARQAIGEAKDFADQVRHPAGTAFALQAECVLHGLSAEMEALDASLSDLTETLEELGTYPHLRIAPVWLTRSEANFAEAAAACEWPEPEGLEARLRSCLGG